MPSPAYRGWGVGVVSEPDLRHRQQIAWALVVYGTFVYGTVDIYRILASFNPACLLCKNFYYSTEMLFSSPSLINKFFALAFIIVARFCCASVQHYKLLLMCLFCLLQEHEYASIDVTCEATNAYSLLQNMIVWDCGCTISCWCCKCFEMLRL